MIIGNAIMKQTVYQNGAYRSGLVDGYMVDVVQEPQAAVEVIEHETFGPWWYPISGSIYFLQNKKTCMVVHTYIFR